MDDDERNVEMGHLVADVYEMPRAREAVKETSNQDTTGGQENAAKLLC